MNDKTPAMKTHSVKFTDADWNTLTALAAGRGVTVGRLINDLLSEGVEAMGYQWNSGKRRARGRWA